MGHGIYSSVRRRTADEAFDGYLRWKRERSILFRRAASIV
jgi:hypothetical protein